MKLFHNSLQNKLVLFLLFAIIIPILTSIIVTYNYTKSSVKKSYIEDNTTLLYQGSTNILNYLNRINQTSLLIYQDSRNERSLYKIIEKEEISFADEQDMYVSMQFMMNSLAEVKQIYIYMNKSDLSYRFAYNLRRNTSGPSYTPEFRANQDIYMESTHRSHTYGINKFPFELPQEVITIHRKILNQPTDEVLGSLSIDIKTDMINEIAQMLYASGDEQLYLLNQDRSIIYASERLDSNIQNTWMDVIMSRSAPSGQHEYQDEAFNGIHLYHTISTPFTEWTLVKRVPYEHLYKNARQLTLINSLIVISFLVIAVIATLYISFHFTSPIKQLIRYINKIEAGKLDAELDTQRTDEIGILSRRFHQMMQRLDQLINKEYRLELANKTNQLKALQAQVNPHFMNNALQSIGTLALQNNEKKIYSLISSLGKMMRYQMNTNEVLVPVSAEIDYVKAYLDLQSQRFDEKLNFHIDVAEEAKRIEVPRMILQPIVENCFKHGFIKQNNVGDIHIAVLFTHPHELVVQVEDNGAGMEEKELAALQTRLNLPHSGVEGNSIGLSNVLSRLRLYFDRNAFITLENKHPQGLKVTLSIPLKEGENADHEGSHRR
jgi:two-component system sensor histidine kinase YesM